MKNIARAALLIFAIPAMAHANSECGTVSIADMNWNSASAVANIDKFILANGFGCKAELVPGDTMPTGTSMTEKGEPDLAPEFWLNSMKDAIERGVSEKRLRVVGKTFSEGGKEGFWVPSYMVEKDPSLATIKGVIANAKLFKNPENKKRFAFMGCPAGWNCQITSGNLFKALKLKEAGFDLIDPGSGAALAASISKAYERKEPWFGYYWSPTAIMGKYKMTLVDFQSGIDEDHHINCISKSDCSDPKVTMYPSSPVQTIITEEFARRAGSDILSYLAKRSFSDKDMSEILAWMEEHQADGNLAMEHFLKTREDMWTTWVSPAAAEKIKAALQKL